jgi:hypothetical protein
MGRCLCGGFGASRPVSNDNPMPRNDFSERLFYSFPHLHPCSVEPRSNYCQNARDGAEIDELRNCEYGPFVMTLVEVGTNSSSRDLQVGVGWK